MSDPVELVDLFDVVQPRVPDGLGLHLKSRATGRHYRIEPVRHPEQPRFWVLRMVRCQRIGVSDNGFAPWLGRRSYTLAELPAVFTTIKADLGGWLASDDHAPLRQWIDEGEQSPMMSIVATLAQAEFLRRNGGAAAIGAATANRANGTAGPLGFDDGLVARGLTEDVSADLGH